MVAVRHLCALVAQPDPEAVPALGPDLHQAVAHVPRWVAVPHPVAHQAVPVVAVPAVPPAVVRRSVAVVVVVAAARNFSR